MFNWYRRASRCYVFLPDVTSPTDPEPWIPSFRASRWFTRGWALQELIAPKTVQFFAKDSSLLGDKHSLLSLIGEESPQTLLAMSDLCVVYTMQYRYQEADELLIKISAAARMLGRSEIGPAMLVSMSRLADVYLEKGKFEKAEGVQMQVLQLRRDSGVGEEHPGTLGDIDHLSRIYEAEGRYKEALPLALRVLEMKRRDPSDDDLTTTMSLMARLSVI